jgi:hypothetical protein
VGCDAFALDHQSEQQVLGANEVRARPPRFFEGEDDDLFDSRRRSDLLDDPASVLPENRPITSRVVSISTPNLVKTSAATHRWVRSSPSSKCSVPM